MIRHTFNHQLFFYYRNTYALGNLIISNLFNDKRQWNYVVLFGIIYLVIFIQEIALKWSDVDKLIRNFDFQSRDIYFYTYS